MRQILLSQSRSPRALASYMARCAGESDSQQCFRGLGETMREKLMEAAQRLDEWGYEVTVMGHTEPPTGVGSPAFAEWLTLVTVGRTGSQPSPAAWWVESA